MALGLSFLLLSTDGPLSADVLKKSLQERWSDLPPITEVNQDQGMVSLSIGEASVILGKMPAPFPWSDLEGPCQTSILWKNAAKELKPHKIHWIVTVNADLEPIPLSVLLTQVTAAALKACPAALGVYWGNATLIVPKRIFVEMAEEILPSPTLDIWVDFRVGRATETTSAGFTAGMKALGHMEIEANSSPEEPSELRARLHGLAHYLLEHGPVVKNGDTIGESESERIRVVYAKSSYGHKEKVMRLEYGDAGSGKPWWRFW